MSPDKVFEKLPRGIPYYLSFDIDGVSPSFAPETGTPIIGGLTYYQAVELVDYVARNFQLAGVDFVEVGGKSGSRLNQAAGVAARCLFEVLLGKAKFKPLESYLLAHTIKR
jgi:arginase family enzyme